MLFNSVLDSLALVLGFVISLFGLLLALAWLEHPVAPRWWRRLTTPRPARVPGRTPSLDASLRLDSASARADMSHT
jgi:hypothetical protein